MPQKVAIAINTLPFWSRFTISTDLRWDGVNLFRTQFTAGFSIPVFDYRRGAQSASALEGSRATQRDTILVQANQTRGGGAYRIRGLSFTKDGEAYERSGVGNQDGTIHTMFPSTSVQPGNGASGPQCLSLADLGSLDSFMAQAFLKYFRTEIQIDGSKRILEMGPTILYPGVGGPTNGIVDTTNGQPFVANFMKLPEGIMWNPSGSSDSNLEVQLQASYQFRTPTFTTPNGTATGAPISVENPVLPGAVPTALGRLWTQGWICNFHGVEESPVSNIS